MMNNDDQQQAYPPTIPGQQGAQQNTAPDKQGLLRALLGRIGGAGGAVMGGQAPPSGAAGPGGFLGSLAGGAPQQPQAPPPMPPSMPGMPPMAGEPSGFSMNDGYTPGNGGGIMGLPQMQPGTSLLQLLQQQGNPGIKQPIPGSTGT